jgi:hypothetical protein
VYGAINSSKVIYLLVSEEKEIFACICTDLRYIIKASIAAQEGGQ